MACFEDQFFFQRRSWGNEQKLEHRVKGFQNAGNECVMFEGKILPVTLKLGAPILISNLFLVFYFAADTYFISLIDQGSTALLSGTGLIFPILYLFYATGNGISTGMASLIARGIGKNDLGTIHMAADSGLFLVLFLCCVTLPLGFLFSNEIMELLAGKELGMEALSYGRTYFLYLLPGFGMLLFLYLFFGIFQGEGDMTPISIASVIAGVSNIILDPILIFIFGMGVKGAAIATGISYGLAGLYAIYVFLKKKSILSMNFRISNVNGAILLEIVRIGFPESLSMLSLALIYIALNTLVSAMGESEMSAWTLCAKTDAFVVMPAYAISAATLTMAGQNYGRKNIGRIAEIYRLNLITGMASALLFAGLYSLGAPLLFSCFSSVEAVVAGAVRQARIISFSFAGVAAVVISASLFQATGRPMPAMILRVARLIVFIVPSAYLFVKGLGWGMAGIFAGIVFGNTAILFISWKWTHVHIRELIKGEA
jgi:putative MATE family efflux protein